MTLPFNFNCVSDCFKQTGEKIDIEIHNDMPNFEERIQQQITTLIEEKLVPLIEKIVVEYIEKRFPVKES